MNAHRLNAAPHYLFVLAVSLWHIPASLLAADRVVDHFPEAAKSGCMACHGGIELIREPDSQMMEQIMELGPGLGDPAGCVVCHNGDPSETKDKAIAHGGDDFFRIPSSPWVNAKTCGQCHEDQVRVQWQSLMMTEAGKIQGVAWAFGSLTGYEHRWANYAVENPDSPDDRLGTDAYRSYMQALKRSSRTCLSIARAVARAAAS